MARYIYTPYANRRRPPLEAFVVQLREAKAETVSEVAVERISLVGSLSRLWWISI